MKQAQCTRGWIVKRAPVGAVVGRGGQLAAIWLDFCAIWLYNFFNKVEEKMITVQQPVGNPGETVTIKKILDGLGIPCSKSPLLSSGWIEVREVFMSKGVPYKALVKFSQTLQINPINEASVIFGIPQRTLLRRKDEGRLNSNESMSLLISAELFQKAVVVFGDEETAVSWLKEPNRAIRNKCPIELFGDDIGRKLVEDLLGRIKHGIYE